MERGPISFYLRSLARNLWAGLRLAFFLPVRAVDYRGGPIDFALVVATDFAFWLLAAAERVDFAGEFNLDAVPAYFASIPLVLAAALIIASTFRLPERTMLVATALVASDPVFEAIGVLLPAVMPGGFGTGTIAIVVLLAWVWLASMRAVVVTAGTRRPQLYIAGFAVTAMIAIAFFVFPQTEPWRLPEEEVETAALTDEKLFHAQGELIERALAEIQPGHPGRPELYFVGFAPDGSQDVFLREMRFVKRLFDERFGAAGHSIALASSESALDELPIASVTNLSRALERVGQAMNPDEDVLFLFISAHGDRAHRLSAWQPPLDLASLTPTALSRLLHDSGIRWKVIVVSACYAGGFIEPLRDENTLVITAAAADRSSFGCESGRDFTYFGEAYFRQALAKTRSFAGAFQAAREIIARKEAAEKLTPSLPQMWIGPAIADRLKNLSN